MSRAGPSVALLGGTGRLGAALALRFAMSGVRVHIGSRDPLKAARVADVVRQRLAASPLDRAGTATGHTNADASDRGETIVIAVPFDGLRALLSELAPSLSNRVVVSAVVPLRRDPRLGPVAIDVPEGSAAELVQSLVPGADVVAAFHSLSSTLLNQPARSVDSDVVVTGDHDEAKATTISLAQHIRGVRGVDGGSLRNSRFSEGLAVLLLSVNLIYHAHAGVIITDLPDGRP